MGSNLIDEIDCANFFDQIDDLIEFPPENECDNVVGLGGNLINSSDLSDDFPNMWNDGTLPNSEDIFSNNSASDLSAELSVPYHDIMQLEWLSTFVEDSFSDAGLDLKKEITCPNKKDSNFRTSSPISVLESSSSSTNSSSIANIPPCGPQRARSKRPRPPTFNPRPGYIENFTELSNSQAMKIPELTGPEQKNKKKKKKDKENETSQDVSALATIRKCMHCEITKTPQWRAGPMGPKTLCNACGVRFKSGRLFPEYRPAASPTFVPSVHSNSHKKVLEMRNRVGDGGNIVTVPVVNKKPKSEDLVSNHV